MASGRPALLPAASARGPSPPRAGRRLPGAAAALRPGAASPGRAPEPRQGGQARRWPGPAPPGEALEEQAARLTAQLQDAHAAIVGYRVDLERERGLSQQLRAQIGQLQARLGELAERVASAEGPGAGVAAEAPACGPAPATPVAPASPQRAERVEPSDESCALYAKEGIQLFHALCRLEEVCSDGACGVGSQSERGLQREGGGAESPAIANAVRWLLENLDRVRLAMETATGIIWRSSRVLEEQSLLVGPQRCNSAEGQSAAGVRQDEGRQLEAEFVRAGCCNVPPCSSPEQRHPSGSVEEPTCTVDARHADPPQLSVGVKEGVGSLEADDCSRRGQSDWPLHCDPNQREAPAPGGADGGRGDAPPEERDPSGAAPPEGPGPGGAAQGPRGGQDLQEEIRRTRSVCSALLAKQKQQDDLLEDLLSVRTELQALHAGQRPAAPAAPPPPEEVSESLEPVQRGSRRVRFQLENSYGDITCPDSSCDPDVGEATALLGTPTRRDPDTGPLEAFVRSWIMEAMRGTSSSVGLDSFVDPADIVELFQQICRSGGLPQQVLPPNLTPRTCGSRQATAVERAVHEAWDSLYPEGRAGAAPRRPRGPAEGSAGETGGTPESESKAQAALEGRCGADAA